MRYLEIVRDHALAHPDAPALVTTGGLRATYGWLWEMSERVAHALVHDASAGPVAVVGHKSPWMIASFLGCMKAGRPYVPIDRFSVPPMRAHGIVEQLVDPLVLDIEPYDEALAWPVRSWDQGELERLVRMPAHVPPESWVRGEDLCYILFTSGSTGAPKGVEVTADNFVNFCLWSLSLTGLATSPMVYLDQAPFSFDLSVFELAGGLAQGGTLLSLEHDVQESPRRLMGALSGSAVAVWVSTPSFAELCLACPEFDQTLLPELSWFIFCGETLANKTARFLMNRFPSASIYNTYGPTESTVAVTSVEVTPQMAASALPIPVGAPKPGTCLSILDGHGRLCGPDTWGEVVITGDTVAKGYYGRADLTQRAFIAGEPGRPRSYRTGDEGCLDSHGVLHYRGRLDSQVKLNGYRIELGEIEAALGRIAGVERCAVTPAVRDGKVSHLVAHVVAPSLAGDAGLAASLSLKDELSRVLPHYMVPRRIRFLDELPLTGNGKIDRRALAGGGQR